MSKNALKFFYFFVLSIAMIIAITVSAGAADNADVYDTIELKNGEQVSGTVLDDKFTVTTPYTNVTCDKDKISEVIIRGESEKHDVVVLKTGGLLEGTIEEPAISFKLVSGKIISLEKEQCKKIVLKRKHE